jgi:hypothetical protein
MFLPMFWPLIGAFVAFVLVAIIMGWVMERGPENGAGPDQHH